MATEIGYCTNVHAGTSLAETKRNLETFAIPVKERVSPQEPMGVGLWLAADAARELLASPSGVADFAAWLSAAGLVPFTFNGFPYGNFHRDVVKHDVYLPTWSEESRYEYTANLIDIQHGLLPADASGSISTLPLAWGTPHLDRTALSKAAVFLRKTAIKLAELRKNSGRSIILSIEPEPGCALQRTEDLIAFFRDWLWGGPEEAAVREHLGVCHDICHAAVMFEEQVDVLRRFAAAGIRIGKLQVSAAVKVDFDRLGREERASAFHQLSGFREPRYLHQTCIRLDDSEPVFYEDLHFALATAAAETVRGQWRTHFHVPIYLDRFGLLNATSQEIRECLAEVRNTNATKHFEVETYAWGVLPPELRTPDLASGIAAEMTWFHEFLASEKK